MGVITAGCYQQAGTAPDPTAESLIAMAGVLVTGQDIEETLRQILELACSALPGGDEGGVTLLEPTGPRTAVATSEIALTVDSSQYTTATGGPCLQAYREQRIVRIESTASDPRWPEFAATAVANGIGSTLSVPLVVSGDGLGALNIYCRRERGFTTADERLAVKLGSCASVALSNARSYWRAARLADDLQQAVTTRGAVDQAIGILIAQRGCSAEQARHLLGAAAQRNHLSLAEVATDLVRRTSTPEEQ